MKILEIKKCPASPWFQSKQIVYKNNEGVELRWDYIERISAKLSVIIVPQFKVSRDFLLVRQYRVIFDKYIIGFLLKKILFQYYLNKGELGNSNDAGCSDSSVFNLGNYNRLYLCTCGGRFQYHL